MLPSEKELQRQRLLSKSHVLEAALKVALLRVEQRIQSGDHGPDPEKLMNLKRLLDHAHMTTERLIHKLDPDTLYKQLASCH